MKIESIIVDMIDVGKRLRQIDEAVVAALMASITRVGQLQPISVYSPDDYTIILVTGAHRLEAMKRLGREDIDVVFVSGDDVERELQEIAENLHRAELTVLERSNQIARWADLTAAKASQVETPSGGHQPTEKGVRKVASDLGLDKSDVQRAVKVAAFLSDEAKQAARDAGLDDNRAALLKVAAQPAEKQVEKIKEIAAEKQLAAAINRAARSRPEVTISLPPDPEVARHQLEDHLIEQFVELVHDAVVAYEELNAHDVQTRLLEDDLDDDMIGDIKRIACIAENLLAAHRHLQKAETTMPSGEMPDIPPFLDRRPKKAVAPPTVPSTAPIVTLKWGPTNLGAMAVVGDSVYEIDRERDVYTIEYSASGNYDDTKVLGRSPSFDAAKIIAQNHAARETEITADTNEAEAA